MWWVILDGISTKDTTKICDAFGNYFIHHPRNIHGSIPISTSHYLDQIENNEKAMYFRNATETVIIEFIMRFNKESGINDISLSYANITSLITWKSYSTSGLYRVSILIFLKLLKLPQYVTKSPFMTYQTTGQCLY